MIAAASRISRKHPVIDKGTANGNNNYLQRMFNIKYKTHEGVCGTVSFICLFIDDLLRGLYLHCKLSLLVYITEAEEGWDRGTIVRRRKKRPFLFSSSIC